MEKLVSYSKQLMVSLSFFVTWRGRAAEMRRMIRDCSEWVSQGKLYRKNVWTGSQVNDLRLENLFFLVLGFWFFVFFFGCWRCLMLTAKLIWTDCTVFFRFNANPVGFKNLPLRIVKCTYWTPTNTCWNDEDKEQGKDGFYIEFGLLIVVWSLFVSVVFFLHHDL